MAKNKSKSKDKKQVTKFIAIPPKGEKTMSYSVRLTSLTVKALKSAAEKEGRSFSGHMAWVLLNYALAHKLGNPVITARPVSAVRGPKIIAGRNIKS